MFSKSSSVGGAKRNKDKRRSSRGKAERDSNPQSTASTAVTPTTTTTTQWYMASPLPADTDRITWAVGTPVFELRQELTPKRPLRSEVERERRLSRPSSGQFPPTRLSTTGANTTTARFNGSSSNRDSIDVRMKVGKLITFPGPTGDPSSSRLQPCYPSGYILHMMAGLLTYRASAKLKTLQHNFKGHCGRHVDMFPCKTPQLVFQGHCGGHVPLQDTPTGVSRRQLSPEARYFQADEAATLTLNSKASELPPVHTPHFVTLVLVTSCELTTHLLDSRLARIRPTLQSQDCPVVWTTDSTASEEDGAPPPLPQKTREADYCNLPDDADRESESIRAPATPRIRNKPPPPPEPLEGSTPPHPPPKKPPLKPPTS
ncbi:unnamed protein product [Timema podura]|uniref:Uncharacterized protein n=1 Tax=Timema podura TaxID=61482 RepID=A0ABN7P1U7_TIMPD|nr:unnamed protein product [Timema podura]